MQAFFGIIYIIFFLGAIVASLFIMFHLSRYALNQKIATAMTVFFFVVTTILLTSNAVLFLSIPFDSLLPTYY